MKQNNDTPKGYINQALKNMTLALPEVIKDKETVPKKIGRSKLMTKDMQDKVIRLAEEWFFMRSVAGKAGISRHTIEREIRDNKDFEQSFTHARDNWIAFHQSRLQDYAQDKKTKDWHSEKYLLTIADKEFSERKYLTEAVANQDAKILMLIKAEQLTLATKEGKEMLKTVVDSPSQGTEPISLLPFEQEDSKNKGKAKVKPKVKTANIVD